MINTQEEFNQSVEKLKIRVEATRDGLIIPGGKKGYLVTEVNHQDVVIKQNRTFQKHKIYRLHDLCINKGFTGPRNHKPYTRYTAFGHLIMKNAIVDYLEFLFKEANP